MCDRDLKLQSKVDSTITYYNIECFCVFMVRRKVEDGGVFGFYSSWGKGNFDMNTNSAQWAQKCQNCIQISWLLCFIPVSKGRPWWSSGQRRRTFVELFW